VIRRRPDRTRTSPRHPTRGHKVRLTKAGSPTLIFSIGYCIDERGLVSSTRVLEPSGLPSYDTKAQRAVAAWTFQPYMLEGKVLKACSAVTFIYNQN
jgi:TonB family protein